MQTWLAVWNLTWLLEADVSRTWKESSRNIRERKCDKNRIPFRWWKINKCTRHRALTSQTFLCRCSSRSHFGGKNKIIRGSCCLALGDYKCSCTVAPERAHHTASERCRTAIPTQFMLWKQCCQAALSLTLSCDNPSSVIHKQLVFFFSAFFFIFFWLGRTSRQSTSSQSTYVARMVGWGGCSRD